MKKLVLILITSLILIMGCATEVTDEEFPANPHIRGEVISINKQAIELYVEGENEEGSISDKAYVKINIAETAIYIIEDGRDEIGIFSMIDEGDMVKVWFTGPVDEAYPVKATAGKIFIYKN